MAFYDPEAVVWTPWHEILETLCGGINFSLPHVRLPKRPANYTLGAFEDKNWATFSWHGKLLWTYSIKPFIVCDMEGGNVGSLTTSTRGRSSCVVCVQRYTSDPADSIFLAVDRAVIEGLSGRLVGSNEHGGKYLVDRDIVDEGNDTITTIDYHLNGCASYYVADAGAYIGVFHAIGKIRRGVLGVNETYSTYRDYQHFFYQQSSEPPFRLLKISRPIDLHKRYSLGNMFGRNEYRNVAFVSGFQYQVSDTDREFMLSYGSGDFKSHIKVMSLQEVLALF